MHTRRSRFIFHRGRINPATFPVTVKIFEKKYSLQELMIFRASYHSTMGVAPSDGRSYVQGRKGDAKRRVSLDPRT